MNEEEIIRGLATLRAILDESDLSWIRPEPAHDGEGGMFRPSLPRAQLVSLLRELRAVLVDAPAMAEQLLAETGADRVVFKSDPVEELDGVAGLADVTFIDRRDIQRRMEIARNADGLIADLSRLANE